MPDKLELIIVFGLIALTDTYFLVDSIVRKIDEISETSLDKQIELVKVEKGIYSVAKREETTNIKQHDALVEEFEQLKAENERLVNELIEQQKLFTKLIVAKNLENTNRNINSSERISKLLVQLNGTSNGNAKETLELLEEINHLLTNYYTNGKDNVRRMRAN